MPQIMKDIVAWAGAIAAISGALAIIIKPIRSWFWYVFKKKCGITEIEQTNSALTETICGLKEELESLHGKINSLLDMATNQDKAQCDVIRGRPSHKLCKPPRRCKIEAPERRFRYG